MNTPVYLGLLILNVSKIVIYEFWYNCVKPNYEEKTKLSYMHCVKYAQIRCFSWSVFSLLRTTKNFLFGL